MGNNLDRRSFLKASLMGTVAAAVATATVAKETFNPLVAQAADIVAPIKETSEFPYTVDEKYQRLPGNKVYYQRVFDTEENKTPMKFVHDDVSEITGKKDTGKDLPRINAEKLGIKGRNATVVETGVLFFPQHDGTVPLLRQKEVGWRQLDVALSIAAWSVEYWYNGFTALGFGPAGIIQHYPINPETNEMAKEPVVFQSMFNWDNTMAEDKRSQGLQWKFNSAEEATKIVKKAARFLGADLVGIAPYDDRWTYGNWCRPKTMPFKLPNGRTVYMPYNLDKYLKNREVEVFGQSIFEADWVKYAGFQPKNVIALAFEMDYESYRTSPSIIEGAGTGKIYSTMGEVSFKLATFLRELGYYAIPSGNDTGMSVPIAVQAGLGEAGRNGMLVTQKYGPRVRIAKVYTDLELVPDKPRSFGVREFCRLCMKCADACPSQAISHEKEARVLQPQDCGTSEVPYTLKWHVDAHRCHSFWAYNSGECGNCIAVCSWNKIGQWNHDIARIATQVPLVQDAARKFDEWFGYNGPVNPEERIESGYVTNMVNDFWSDTEPTK
ncbi:reductive dehalogenase [Dehalobacter sp. 14DCB1]|uniref:reductive dehalogenase n=1 Tax=Dehalobacter sp. 14DCB1 TaxID=2070227 RepID=UPI00104D815F|nr:reductive dehalogenase [Dehalobacter sp. 14DCB1]TCX51697.1 reductive dehalogenase [Dehalobacter sp. 14DCB1]